MQHTREVTFLLVVVGLLLAGSSARAARPTESIVLRYAAPEGCPDREAVLRAIDTLLDDAPTLDRTLEVSAEVSATDDDAYALELAWKDEDGAVHREIEAESCQAAADAAAWLIAQALKRPETTTPNPLRYEVVLQGASEFGALPGVAWGATLRLGLSWAALHVDLSASYFPAKTTERAGVALELRAGFVAIRKEGGLFPGETLARETPLDRRMCSSMRRSLMARMSCGRPGEPPASVVTRPPLR